MKNYLILFLALTGVLETPIFGHLFVRLVFRALSYLSLSSC